MKSEAIKTRSNDSGAGSAQTTDKYLTPAEVAARYRIKPYSLANMRNRGDGPEFVKFGSRVLYPADKLEAYIQNRTGGKFAK